ncbi:hypothetical protein FQN60_005024 [Etheostoma spectabile]|uniref:Thioredoxin domain-containing protein n=1 Tax=Etheostoma spectabile TaxID=54343 RepID=A0A5J5DLT1_9PERO|nr:hypothetical protein FQN60_005024 [Etheostoma spectabile]
MTQQWEHLADASGLTGQMKLWNKYKVTSIPSLVFVDAATGKVVCRNGLLVVRDDPKGLEFPWGPKPFAEVVAGPLLRNNRQTTDSSSLEGHYVGVYFSAHWCPPCRSLTRVLVESYRTVKESGQKFEIVFVSADRWCLFLIRLLISQGDCNQKDGIPTLILLDTEGHMITRQGRVEVLNDPECRLFPWHPRPVLELSESNAVQLHEGPCLVLFVDAEEEGELEPAKELIQPIAEKLMAKYKAKEEEMPLLFFVAGEDGKTQSVPSDFLYYPRLRPNNPSISYFISSHVSSLLNPEVFITLVISCCSVSACLELVELAVAADIISRLAASTQSPALCPPAPLCLPVLSAQQSGKTVLVSHVTHGGQTRVSWLWGLQMC